MKELPTSGDLKGYVFYNLLFIIMMTFLRRKEERIRSLEEVIKQKTTQLKRWGRDLHTSRVRMRNR